MAGVVSDSVSVLLGGAGGSFGAATNFAAGNGPCRSRWAMLTITAVNDVPTATVAAGDSCGSNDRSGTLTLTPADVDNAAARLTLSGVSGNPALVATKTRMTLSDGPARARRRARTDGLERRLRQAREDHHRIDLRAQRLATSRRAGKMVACPSTCRPRS